MAGRAPLRASDEQRVSLIATTAYVDRAQADRAHAILLTLPGWTRDQHRMSEAFGVRDDTVRLWRSDSCATASWP